MFYSMSSFSFLFACSPSAVAGFSNFDTSSLSHEIFFYNTTLTRRMKFAAVKMFAKSHPILNLSSGTTKWATVKRRSFLFSARERGERKWWKRYCTIKFQVSSLCTCEMHRRYRAECGNLTFVVTRRGGMLIVCCIIEFKTSRSLVVVLCSSEFIHVACFVQFYR